MRKHKTHGLTAERLRELLHYDPSSGEFRWKVRKGPQLAGAPAGHVWKNGYVVIGIDRHIFPVGRLAWLYMTGEWPEDPLEVDHHDLDKTNNRWANLRLATMSQNRRNVRAQRRKKDTPLKGVNRIKGAARPWQARISVDSKTIYLGAFPTAEEAHAAYCKAADDLHGEFARST